MNKLPFLVFSTILFFSACKTAPVGGDLENTHWLLTQLKKGKKLVSLPDDSRVTLKFLTEELSGAGVCNQYSADIEVEGTTLTLDGFEATEMACENLDFENLYFQALGAAHSYSVLKDKLIVFSENAELSFSAMTEEEVKADDFSNGAGKLAGQFPPMKDSAIPHLYPIVRVDNPGKYPLKGTLIDTSFYKYFDAQSSDIWSSTGGDVLAVGRYGDFYVCRIPGRYVSSDIALFRLKDGQFHRSETVAWAWCDEGWCNQQDAWLKDVNGDSRTDLIQHYTLTDDKGKVKEERLSILLQSEDGTFKEDKSIQVDKSQFKMAKI